MRQLNADTVKELSRRYGDAFYLLESEQFLANYKNLTAAFRKYYRHFNIAYSYKTNYTPRLCEIVNENGGYAEVVSEMEVEIALHAGVLPEKIIWNGPVKDCERADWLLQNGGTVNIDSVYELEHITALAKRFPEKQINVGIRCNFDVNDGVISRFGFDVEDETFTQALGIIKDNIHLIGLQCHFAKRNAEYWPARAAGMAELMLQVAEKIGYLPDRVDLGGAMFGNMPDSLKAQFSAPIASYDDYAEAAAKLFAEKFPDEAPELLVEPGSALAGDSMRFVGKVKTIKTVRGKTFATVLGSQKNISMGGVNPPLEVIACAAQRSSYDDLDLVGYTCIENDVLYRHYTGEIGVGDYIVISNCGSYSVVMKPPFILPNFPVIDICGDAPVLIKRQETFGDLFHTYTF